jgi:hypothetical protein
VRCYCELFGETCQELRNSLPLPPFLPTPPDKEKACMKSELSTVQVESEQLTIQSSNQTQLEKEKPLPPPPRKEKREAPSLPDATSYWSHGNSIPIIGCHYFRPGLDSPS